MLKKIGNFIFYSSALLLLMIIFASYCGKWSYLCDILSNFRVYYVFASIIFIVIACIFRKIILIISLLLVITIQLFSLGKSYISLSVNINKSNLHEELTLLQFNAYFLNPDYSQVISYIEKYQEKFDVIFIQEVSSELENGFKRIEKFYPYKMVSSTDSWFGLAILSKHPILNYQIKFFNKTPMCYCIVNLQTKDKAIPFTIYGIHALAPISMSYAKIRNDQFRIISEEITQDIQNENKILIGDFNTTSYSYWFKSLEDSTGLISAEKGTGINNTWPSWMPFNLLRLSLDNALVSNNIVITKRTIEKDLGSDHLPVVLKLKIFS